MTKKWLKKGVALGLIAAMTATCFAGCGSKKSASSDDSFTWWITQTDGQGQYYDTYDQSPSAQFIMQQSWDTENGGIDESGKGTKLNLEFQTPISGSEQDNFNTMISTGEYPDLVNTIYSTDNPESLCESGVAMDITEYVEKYMPNYLAYLDENPFLKPQVTSTDEDGNVHYYAIYALQDGTAAPWEGYCYRRDWLVKYATPSEYVWDWDSATVKENGHPAVTPLAEAQKANNLDGWKKNDVTSFTSEDGADPANDYTDNVIFPSGKTDPYTISDWEWMFEAFEKAINEGGWSSDSSSYCTSVGYGGYNNLGDVVSSFGGGAGSFYTPADGDATYAGTSDGFKTYIEAMANWYKEGWLDKDFNTRSSDLFFMINSAGVSQGKVGMWCGLSSTVGTAIRTTCADTSDAKDAFVMGAALPINDTYGTDAQKFFTPDTLFQDGKKGTATIVTTKAKDKDLATLFTFLDWTYTREGSLVLSVGLDEDQYKSVKLDPDLYADNNLTSAYTTSTGDDGKTVYTLTVGQKDAPLNTALTGIRFDTGLKLSNSDTVQIDNGEPKVNADANVQYNMYENTSGRIDYTKMFTAEESQKYNEVYTATTDYINQNLPGVVKGTMSWKDYVAGLEKIDTSEVVKIYQKYVDQIKKIQDAE